jgi:UDPglucose 6-dehydrogenase
MWGLAFKQDTDDTRESPGLDIARILQQRGASVVAYDPAAVKNAQIEVPEIDYASDPYAAVEGADALLITTPWNEFKQADLRRVRELMRTPVLLDGRNIYKREEIGDLGFIYAAVGR